MRTYDSIGRIIRRDGHLYRSRAGGDTSSTAGYNIGSALSNINARGKMMRSALLAITDDQDAPLPVRPAESANVETVSAVQPPPTNVAVKGDGTSDDARTSASSFALRGKATAEISSSPSGADIEIDGGFVGSTPSSVGIAAGEHTLRVSKNGYKQWERTLRSSTGNIRIAAALEPIPVASGRTLHAAAEADDTNPSPANQSSLSVLSATPSKGDSPSTAATPTVRVPEPAASSPSGPLEETLIGVSFAGNPTVRHDGVEISGVQPKGPSDSIDIKPGDVILAFDTHYLFTIDEVRAELLRYKPGTRLLIRYRRNQFISENYLTIRAVLP